MNYRPTQPVQRRWLPNADLSAELPKMLIDAYKLDSYPGAPLGDLREVDMVGIDGQTPIGVLWTNDADGCDLRPPPDDGPIDNLSITQTVLMLRALRHEGLSATEAFDKLAGSGRITTPVRTVAHRRTQPGGDTKKPRPDASPDGATES